MRRAVKILMVWSVVLLTTLTPSIIYAKSLKREAKEQLRKFEQFYSYLSENHLDTLNHSQLIEVAISSVLNECDPHSRYLNKEQSKKLIERIDEHSSICEATMLNSSTGYIRVGLFGRNMSQEFLVAVRELGEPTNLIVDLRGNSGGVVSQALTTAGYFLPKDATIISSKGRRAPQLDIETKKDGELLGTRLWIIIDHSTASASEIVASSLQEHKRATVVGEMSFGKGLIVRELFFKDGTMALISIAQYLTPSGKAIQSPYKGHKLTSNEGGITPNIEINMDDFNIQEIADIIFER